MSSKTNTGVHKSITHAHMPLLRNDARVIICFAAAATVATTASWSAINITHLLIIGFAFGYTGLSYLFLKSRPDTQRKRFFDLVTTADAAVIGFVLNAVHFSFLPFLLFVLVIQFNSIMIGGMSKWMKDNVALFCGVALTFFFWEPEWNLETSLPAIIASFIGLVTYFCACALHLHSYIERLEKNTQKLIDEQTAHKLRTYKLANYLSPTVWQAISEDREHKLKTERKRVTVFFSDIEGFSSLAEELEAETIAGLLNTYLTEMTKIVGQHKGTVDKFMGDGLMVIFGDSESEGLKADCVRCVSMAIQMRKKMRELQTLWTNQGIKKPLQIRMGINTGYCTVGTFGTSHYKDYTVLGTHVNLASRLESAASAGEILVSHETWLLVKDVIMCRDQGEIKVKGFSNPVKVYQVVDFRKDLGKHQSYFEDYTQGFAMSLDLEQIRNYDKERILKSLKHIIDRINDKLI